MALMQSFLVKKGIINDSMNEKELQDFLTIEQEGPAAQNLTKGAGGKRSVGNRERGKETHFAPNNCELEVTIYKHAVESQNGNSITENEIAKFIGNIRAQSAPPNAVQKRKVSLSSEEFMDTSDELDQIIGNSDLIAGGPQEEPQPGKSNDRRYSMTDKTPEQQAQQYIQDAEKAKATLFEVEGKTDRINCVQGSEQSLMQIDVDYQMIDTHLDKATKVKIQNFEYIDFSKLILWNRVLRDADEQRLEIVNKI